MRVIVSVPWDEATMLVSTTATESVDAWIGSTTYSTGDLAVRDNYVWRSLKDSNLNRDPLILNSEVESDEANIWWERREPDNQSSMFVSGNSSATSATSPLTAKFSPGKRINALMLRGIVGLSVRVKVKSDDVEVYDSGVISLIEGTMGDWYEYYFGAQQARSSLVLLDLPPYEDPEVEVSITGTDTVACGVCIFGTSTQIGETQIGVRSSISDYSDKTTDAAGNTLFSGGQFSDRLECTIFVERGQFNRVRKLLTDIKRTPCGWVPSMDDDYVELATFGWARDFTIAVEYPENFLCSLEIEGLA